MAGRKRITPENFNEDKLGINPFIRHLRVVVKKTVTQKDLSEVKESEEAIVDIERNTHSITSNFLAEVENYTKVYHDASRRKIIGEMPARAKELFVWLMYEIKPPQDFVIINIERYKQENRCSHNTYTRSITDLVINGILLATLYPNIFWINPAFFFCGSRIRKYKENVVEFQNRQSIDERKITDVLK